jgi:hypothetical protein
MVSENVFSTQALIQNWTLIAGIIFPNRAEGVAKTKDLHLQEMAKVSCPFRPIIILHALIN